MRRRSNRAAERWWSQRRAKAEPAAFEAPSAELRLELRSILGPDSASSGRRPGLARTEGAGRRFVAYRLTQRSSDAVSRRVCDWNCGPTLSLELESESTTIRNVRRRLCVISERAGGHWRSGTSFPWRGDAPSDRRTMNGLPAATSAVRMTTGFAPILRLVS